MKPDLVDACENLRKGTALFAKIYRIVTKWYGNPTEKEIMQQVLDDAIIAWQTGYFEGTAVFRAPDTEETRPVEPASLSIVDTNHRPSGDRTASSNAEPPTDADTSDPNKAGIRVNLSTIGTRQP